MARVNNKNSTTKNNSGSVGLSAETKHGLVVVGLVALSIIFILSFLDLSGLVGQGLKRGLIFTFGWSAYLIPVILLMVGYALMQPGWRIQLRQVVGLFLFLSGLAGLTHSALENITWWQAVKEGVGGGYLGFIWLWALTPILGDWGAIVLLLTILVAGLLVLFDTSPISLFKRFKDTLASWQSALNQSVVNSSPINSKEDKAALWRETKPPKEEEPVSRIKEQILPTLDKVFKKRPVDNLLTTLEVTEPEVVKLPLPPRQIQIKTDLLEERKGKPTSGDIEANKEKIRRTLLNFGIEVEMGPINIGPTVTQYTLAPSQGVKLSHITTLSNDLALALAAHPIRIEAPIPGQSLVGIEMPNQTVALVGLRDIIESEAFKKRSSNLTFSLGRDVAGQAFVANLEKMPHLLIAGATGSGKSVCINTILLSLLYTNSPDELKLILVDPKRVELASYNDIPHLLTPVITDVNKTINSLKWVVGEMDRRYQVLSSSGKRNIQAFNQLGGELMPYIVVVIDELADLMAVAAQDVEAAIIRLAQMARAVGIHLIVATQRPSVDVITGLIKANITSRIAFAVASSTDSRTILDTSGAEKLLGRGDSLFISADLSKPKRIQAAFVGDGEIEKVTNFLKQAAKPDYNPEVVVKQYGRGVNSLIGGSQPDDDELLPEAQEIIIRAGKASASFLQRRLRVGYARAARLLDLLEEKGIIGPGDGAKPREVLVSQQDLMNDTAGLPEEADSSEVVDDEELLESEEEAGDDFEEK
ncbi:DNA translocase FtsK [Patescibacteria group bacterium]|nr:DNA translocase FtsK [Patescibacteria group bacterium]